ncbi:alpha-L-fucosidase [uncultured Bacteroides sp.]|uniref:alpha-L-fucosidase n=1 Tax=uncultured Bacteroides sp. TaxID=162156 RepID=UPI002AAB6B14|nr:alpha-L-fucosidase [uncultured Bacteroides sp.]
MKNILFATLFITLFGQTSFAQGNGQSASTSKEPMQTGKFEPTWESLKQYEVPEWYRNAKFGIWAHWGPQCQPEDGDWYGRGMYEEGSRQYKSHLKKYGHPSKFGFKDVIHEWKAEKWDPEKLVKLYKRAGAQYFFAMGNHHDNFDLWDSKYHNWNSTKIGPKKDILGGWAKAAKHNGLPFGVSIHASHAWTWYETAQGADKQGPLAGIPYDGKLTKKDGKGQWWDGLDPQELYAQNHELSSKSQNHGAIHSQWDWADGASVPSKEYCDNFYDRTVDMINKYNPDLLYFDDTALPLWPVSDAGLRIAADFYNSNMKRNNGKLDAVIFGKVLTPEQKECIVWDVERGAPDKMQEKAWQTCSCIGDWHYNRSVYDNNQYKSAKTVIQMLADIVSKNGNLLLNIPVRGDGTIDDKEVAVLEGIAGWMDINKESIFDTRPWTTFGEGPDAEKKNPMNAQGFNEGKNKYTAEDIRFTEKKGTLYAIVMEWPENGKIVIKSLSANSPNYDKEIKKVQLLGHGKISFTRDSSGLIVTLPEQKSKNMPLVLKINN